jgi:purine-binding chemotaxis protein CheW
MLTKKIKKTLIKNSASQLLPKDPHSHAILLERAKLLAQYTDTKNRAMKLVDYVRFRLGSKEYYGIPYSATKEVLFHVAITKLAHTPDYIAGIINRHGALITLIDLKQFFHLHTAAEDKATYIIIVETNNITVGILADHVEGSAAYDPNKIAAPLVSKDVLHSEYVLGLDQGITAILNMEAIVSNISAQLHAKQHENVK